MAHNQSFLDWLRRVSSKAEITCSICTGSLLLGQAGLLENRRATTNKQAFQWVADQVKNVCWQANARWVEDDNIFTASGVSAGMDMSLAVIEKLIGPKAAQDSALWSEYLRNEDPNNDPFAMEPK